MKKLTKKQLVADVWKHRGAKITDVNVLNADEVELTVAVEVFTRYNATVRGGVLMWEGRISVVGSMFGRLFDVTETGVFSSTSGWDWLGFADELGVFHVTQYRWSI